MKAFLVVIATVILTSSVRAQNVAPHNESIQADEMKADLFFLASPGMRGRLTGTAENDLAAEFVRSRFERLGLAPAGTNGSFYHVYNLMTATLGKENLLEISSDGSTRRPRVGQDFHPLRFSASGSVRASLVFAGFGITSPELNYDDYSGDAIEGSIVLVLDHEPGEFDPQSPFDGVVPTLASRHPVHKALHAQAQGAVGILYVSDVHNHSGPENFGSAARVYWPEVPLRIERYELGSWAERVRIPAVQISRALARELIGGTGRTLEDLARSAETSRGTTPIPIPGIEIDLTAAVDRHAISDRSVVAILEGSDPDLREEHVLVSAHFDHNGADGNQVFAGADDDASGMVGLLDIAEAYALAAQDGRRPRRSILFAAWNSEERGLTGSFAYTEQPVRPLEKMVAVLNMDMIGRNEEVPIGGGRRFRGLDIQTAESNENALNLIGYSYSDDLVSTVERANQAIGLELKQRYDNSASQLLRRSDHWPFLQHRVPALWIHTGLHPDYHTIYDVPEKINYVKMERVSRLVHQASWDLAQQEGRPRFTPRYGAPRSQ